MTREKRFLTEKFKYSGAIFDLDGVIVNTAKYHYLCWRKLAYVLGFVFTEEDNEKLKGISRMESMDILLDLGGISMRVEEKEYYIEKKNLWYCEYINGINESEILPGAKECLINLKEKGIKVALGSASKNAKMILDKLSLLDLFDVIVDGNMIHKSKPDPEIFLRGASMLALKPLDCVVFEDSEAGIISAKKAGMYTIGVGNSKGIAGADILVQSLSNFNLKEIFR